MRTIHLRLTDSFTCDFDQLAAMFAELGPELVDRHERQLRVQLHHFAQWHELDPDELHDRLAGALWGRR